MAKMTMVEAINLAMKQEMEKDDKVYNALGDPEELLITMIYNGNATHIISKKKMNGK